MTMALSLDLMGGHSSRWKRWPDPPASAQTPQRALARDKGEPCFVPLGSYRRTLVIGRPRLRRSWAGATTSPTTISRADAAHADDASGAASSTASSAKTGKASARRRRSWAIPAAPSAASCARRKPASGSYRACARHPPPRPRASGSPPQSAPVRSRTGGTGRSAPRAPQAAKPQHRTSRPNGRPLCCLFPIRHLCATCARRMARSDHQGQEAVGVALKKRAAMRKGPA